MSLVIILHAVKLDILTRTDMHSFFYYYFKNWNLKSANFENSNVGNRNVTFSCAGKWGCRFFFPFILKDSTNQVIRVLLSVGYAIYIGIKRRKCVSEFWHDDSTLAIMNVDKRSRVTVGSGNRVLLSPTASCCSFCCRENRKKRGQPSYSGCSRDEYNQRVVPWQTRWLGCWPETLRCANLLTRKRRQRRPVRSQTDTCVCVPCFTGR